MKFHIRCTFLRKAPTTYKNNYSLPSQGGEYLPRRKEVKSMRHLNLELEKLEQRIAPGGVPTPGSKSSKSGKSDQTAKSAKTAKSDKSDKSDKGHESKRST